MNRSKDCPSCNTWAENEALREELRARKKNDGVQFAGLNGKLTRYRSVMEQAKEALDKYLGDESETTAGLAKAITALRECLKEGK